MKTLRQTCAVATLCLTLSVSAFAGQISSPGKADPTPPTLGETHTPPSSDLTTTMILTIISLIPVP